MFLSSLRLITRNVFSINSHVMADQGQIDASFSGWYCTTYFAVHVSLKASPGKNMEILLWTAASEDVHIKLISRSFTAKLSKVKRSSASSLSMLWVFEKLPAASVQFSLELNCRSEGWYFARLSIYTAQIAIAFSRYRCLLSFGKSHLGCLVYLIFDE